MTIDWIPVETALPETSEPVLVTVNVDDEVFVMLAYYVGDLDCWYSAEMSEPGLEVLAWSPLPAPYKPKEEA